MAPNNEMLEGGIPTSKLKLALIAMPTKLILQ